MTTYYLVVDTIREKRIIRKYIIIMDQPLNIDKFKEKLQRDQNELKEKVQSDQDELFNYNQIEIFL